MIIPILSDLYSWGRSTIQKLRKPGMYEVLEYKSTLVIMDRDGKVGKFQKLEKIRFLQDNIIAIQDQVWGFDKSITKYKCSPGKPVDFYQSGYKTFVIISLRELRSKNDEIDLNMQWELRGMPIGKIGTWETFINQFTNKLILEIVFPKDRPPIRMWVVEENRKRTIEIDKKSLSRLPDDRRKIIWEKRNPRLFETYTINWAW